MNDDLACEHCPDGHSDPTGRPWAAFIASERDGDGDGQTTHLYVAPTAGQHVAESDAEWVRRRLNPQPPTDAEVEAAARAIQMTGPTTHHGVIGWSVALTMARAALTAARNA